MTAGKRNGYVGVGWMLSGLEFDLPLQTSRSRRTGCVHSGRPRDLRRLLHGRAATSFDQRDLRDSGFDVVQTEDRELQLTGRGVLDARATALRWRAADRNGRAVHLRGRWNEQQCASAGRRHGQHRRLLAAERGARSTNYGNMMTISYSISNACVGVVVPNVISWVPVKFWRIQLQLHDDLQLRDYRLGPRLRRWNTLQTTQIFFFLYRDRLSRHRG